MTDHSMLKHIMRDARKALTSSGLVPRGVKMTHGGPFYASQAEHYQVLTEPPEFVLEVEIAASSGRLGIHKAKAGRRFSADFTHSLIDLAQKLADEAAAEIVKRLED